MVIILFRNISHVRFFCFFFFVAVSGLAPGGNDEPGDVDAEGFHARGGARSH